MQEVYLGDPIRDLDQYEVTSGLGWRYDPISGEKAFHDGIDIGTPVGVECLAMEEGVVKYSNYLWEIYPWLKNEIMGQAIIVRIKYNNGFISQHAHLSQSVVNNGDKVSRGQTIGFTGSTGYVTGAHLHLQLWTGEPYDSNAVDFRNYLGEKLPDIPMDFDEGTYLFLNPDVRAAVSNGQFKSGAEHYQRYGYKEDRKHLIWGQKIPGFIKKIIL